MKKRDTEPTPPKMTTSMRVSIVLYALLGALLVSMLIFNVISPGPASTGFTAEEGQLPGTRANSHVLDKVGDNVPTLVEFLDFECEACGSAYPAVEALREAYRGRINYVIRYFPIESHKNAMNAALAVEAAAQQGKVEGMYKLMYETQADWSEQQESKADLFRTYAEGLGLDMAKYDADVANPATMARIEFDVSEGRAAGVTGTPTFFLDGKKLKIERSSDLTEAVEQALGEQ